MFLKKLLITIAIVNFYIIGYCQSFTLGELTNMIKMDVDNFDTYVSNKGFKFLENKDSEIQKGNSYAFNQNSNSRKAEKFITFYYEYYGKTKRNVTYQTPKTEEYLKIKNQIKSLGFKFKETSNFEGATFLIYFSGKYKLSLISFQSENVGGKTSAVYEISITSLN